MKKNETNEHCAVSWVVQIMSNTYRTMFISILRHFFFCWSHFDLVQSKKGYESGRGKKKKIKGLLFVISVGVWKSVDGEI